MKTFLFAWNAEKWKWPTLKDDILELRQTGIFVEDWSCASHKSVKIGDAAFLIKLGKEPRGIIGSGFVSSEPFEGTNHSGKHRIRVMINFETLRDPFTERILDMETLNSGILSKQHWSTQSSGISIKNDVADELKQVWKEFLRTSAR
ncbi:MAG: hypothetical protein EOO50_00935 [Flavobacterium sp.]|uniref:hypothetical protein n=1 Tax=Flavobacterium sp. TaxID=239 RepID=UPI0012090BF4|nr:hypothetical protein [Flavobacterium sp.]RZJ68776.1 MAG: hypothetical protein EOO50_00935 [Flavobacterium sp.]